jgi:hypothetical protein
MKASYIMGIHEFHDHKVPNEILTYFSMSVFHKEVNVPAYEWPRIAASIALVAGHGVAASGLVYGIPISFTENDNKIIAEHSIDAFVEFMYNNYSLEYEHPYEMLCISGFESQKPALKLTTSPEVINALMFTLEINVKTELLMTELIDATLIAIAKAGFKLNVHSQKDLCLRFNINTSKDIKHWSNMIRRKFKKKFHNIASVSLSSQENQILVDLADEM